jgi:hypothetical protein
MDNQPDLTPFPRRLPDDLLACICTELNNMKADPKEGIQSAPTDKVIQATLLSIQLVSKAGWRAATPHIWRIVTLTWGQNYHSFFAPAIRFVEREPQLDQSARVSRASMLLNRNDDGVEDLQRFFQSTEWIHIIFFDMVPPVELVKEIDLTHAIAAHVIGRPHYFGQGVALHLRGVREMLEIRTESWREEFEMLRRFISISDPTTIELWSPPHVEQSNSKCKCFWAAFASLSTDLDKARLVFHDFSTGYFAYAPYRDITIWLNQTWTYAELDSGAERSLVSELGLWLSNVLHLDSAKLKYNPLKEVTSPKLVIWGRLGCPCGCDAMWLPEKDVQVIIQRISRLAKEHLTSSPNRFNDQLGLSIDDRIKSIFDAKRLEICVEPCDAYKKRVHEKQRSVSFALSKIVCSESLTALQVSGASPSFEPEVRTAVAVRATSA